MCCLWGLAVPGRVEITGAEAEAQTVSRLVRGLDDGGNGSRVASMAGVRKRVVGAAIHRQPEQRARGCIGYLALNGDHVRAIISAAVEPGIPPVLRRCTTETTQ